MMDNGERAAVSGASRGEKSDTGGRARENTSREATTTDSADMDPVRRALEKAQAENARLREHSHALAVRLSAIETSTSWRMMVRLHRVIWWVIGLFRRIAALGSGARRLIRRMLSFGPAPIDADLLETCMIPSWDEDCGTWVLKLDKARLKALRRTKEKAVEATAPYVIKPVVAADPAIKRPLVMHVIANVYVGGSTQLIIDLLENLADRYDQEVVTAALWRGGRHQGMVVHHMPAPLDVEALSALLARKKPSVVHIHYWGLTDEPWYRAALSAIEHIPCKVVENINTPIAPYIHERVDHYIYVSDYVRRHFGAGADRPEKSSVIHPGIDLSRFDKPIDAAKTADAIGMVYRLETDKLREDSIQLFIEIARRRPRTKIYIIGGGSLFHSYVEQTKAAGVRQNFHFTGYVPYGSLPDWYGKFAIFVAPVWQESFGQVTVFAMNKKLAVGGYKVGALPEILGYDDTFGIDTVSAAQKIIALLDDPVRRQALGERNRTRAQVAFGVQAMTARYGEIYDRLLAE
ncbi:MAG: glycosyltransferase [Rhodospirillaceae bacterium]|nr:MAG: glycosyltransferase [Rhodospirillaceae bacterium]